MSNQCRFCESRDQSLVHYSTRHYAHFECYLDAGKPLSALHAWQVGQFPYKLLKERGLLAQAERIAEDHKRAELRHDRFMSKVRS